MYHYRLFYGIAHYPSLHLGEAFGMETPLSTVLNEKGHTVQSIAATHSAYEAAAKMTELKIGALVVLEKERLIGIVSERDILHKVLAKGVDPKKALVSDIMTVTLITVTPTTTVREAMHIVTDNRIRHLPVLNEDKLVGLISIGDLTRSAMEWQEKQIASLTNYIQGERS